MTGAGQPLRFVPARWMFVTMFAISGFTGLIYESIWTRYLQLFLGHAAYAQSLVLAIFMGGMAIGAWWVSRMTGRWTNLVRCYALVEAIIGLAALVFHDLFTRFLDFSLSTAIPALGSSLPIESYRWGMAALLILPQSILLGMTFPLMAGGIIRRFPRESGKDLALLYFANSLGAALGALAAGFWLVAWVGLPGTVRLAGLVNLVLAGLVAWMARAPEPAPSPIPPMPRVGATGIRILIAGAFFTGAASFIYEIAWIRMLSLVMGTTFHTFELMLSAFITGLALGGLWIRKRIDRISDPIAFLGYVQLAMAALAVITLALYNHTYLWMDWLLQRLGTTDGDYAVFSLSCHAIAFVIMLPATCCAGMTLPLFTHLLLRQGHGERSIGRIYAANTLGSITGVLFAVHIGLPTLGLKLLLGTGALIDLVLGLVLLRLACPGFVPRHTLFALLTGLVIAGTIHFVTLDYLYMSRGVYLRRGEPLQNLDRQPFRLTYSRDGKTATIATVLYHGDPPSLSITTNGKPEASMVLGDGAGYQQDEVTMIMSAALPLSLHPQARTVANIGFGSGLTTHVLLAHPGLTRVDTIEIEQAMIEAAAGFMSRVHNAYRDPRSHVHVEDAKTWFARTGRRFDVIFSEPSNPWVSGVGNLFSEEFYRHIRNYLSADGLFVQWLNLYEFNDVLMAQVLAALSQHFENYAIYNAAASDILIVAPRNGILPELSRAPFEIPALQRELARVGLAGPQDMEIRYLGSGQNLTPLYALLAARPNSDYYPSLELEGPRSRFKKQNAESLLVIAAAPLPVMELIDKPVQWWHTHPVQTASEDQIRIARLLHARTLRRSLLQGEIPSDEDEAEEFPWLPAILKRAEQCDWALPEYDENLHTIAIHTLSALPPTELQDLWVTPSWTCALTGPQAELYRAIAERSVTAMTEIGLRELQAAQTQDENWYRFVLTATLTGARASGQEETLNQAWQEHAQQAYPDGEFLPHVLLLAPR